MNRRLIILSICFYALFHRVYGQSPSAAIDSLTKYRVITAKDRPILEKELKDKGGASYRVAILAGLESMMLQKIFHIDPHKTGIAVSYSGEVRLNTKNRDSINVVLRSLLNNINKAGLLTDRVYSYTLKGVDSGRYIADVQMVADLTERSSRLEWLAPDRLLPVAEQLHSSGIVSDSAFLRLEKDIKNRKIESTYQLIAYCKLARTFNDVMYTDDPKVWLEQLHRDIASMLPDLNFSDFSYSTAPDSTLSIGGAPGIKIKVSLVCDGRVYKQTTSVLNYGSRERKMRFIDMYLKTFYHIFNKILIDQRSPYQLHYVLLSHTDPTNDNNKGFALIALRDEQGAILWKEPCASYIFTSLVNYDNTLTSGKIDSAIFQWRKIGLFAHLSDTQIEKAIDDAEADDRFSMAKLLSNFPNVTYLLDTALISQNAPYAKILSHLAKLAHGEFTPTRISQIKVKGGIKLQYSSKGKTHSYTFHTANGWWDDSFPVFMKVLSEENNLQGKFYQVLHEGSVIYLTKEQYDDIVKNGLLALSEDNNRKN